jgi:hypothetical protein
MARIFADIATLGSILSDIVSSAIPLIALVALYFFLRWRISVELRKNPAAAARVPLVTRYFIFLLFFFTSQTMFLVKTGFSFFAIFGGGPEFLVGFPFSYSPFRIVPWTPNGINILLGLAFAFITVWGMRRENENVRRWFTAVAKGVFAALVVLLVATFVFLLTFSDPFFDLRILFIVALLAATLFFRYHIKRKKTA